jgi:NAD(P)-dependent dehydrogenase (short-subunit alcohol dehydrogenase family)
MKMRTFTGLGGLAAGAAVYAAWQAFQHLREEDLAGRVVLITGGSRGLGLLMAREFAAEGCRIAICARDPEELEIARIDLEARGAEVIAEVCDVADPAAVRLLVSAVDNAFGRVDILVNNASIIQVGPLESQQLVDFEEAMAVNYWGTVHATLAVLPQMLERREGRIVNITSIGARVAVPHLLPYDAAKFAAYGFSQGLRSELGKDGIKVSTIVPGLMRTGSPVNALFKGDAEKEFAWFSVGDATPVTAMSARRAARRIVRAARRGEAHVTLSWQAKTLRMVHDLMPGVAADALGWVNRMLPKDANPELRRGMELNTAVSPSPLTGLMNRAARENNQYGGVAEPAPDHAEAVGVREDPHG